MGNSLSPHNLVQLVNINCSPSPENKFGEVQKGPSLNLLARRLKPRWRAAYMDVVRFVFGLSKRILTTTGNTRLLSRLEEGK